ncbi:hypothetical protein MmiEs2_08570 [Methanimicrococcus stummii]|uniref:Molybdopterin synthase sulfur carrier subunit n=1 Tax=Methanimicrococcus stummii TaxID=3028294 RepID=A0AA96ZYY9_9EURY|nr:MoaD/ThiS family protein [Methanimicrococcus sp. Es2]WNY28657.1 hypothetical protein MmiEs2_08570 [Methanimicrococcus sp. Es2]
MKVSISILGIRADNGKKAAEMNISEQSSAKDLILEFAQTLTDPDLIADKDGNLKKHLIIQVNKKRVLTGKAADLILKDGDEVVVYPSVSGG